MTKALCNKSKLFLSNNCAIYIGQPLAPDTHRHYATQLSLAIGSKLELITDDKMNRIECDGVVIGKNIEHSVCCRSGTQLLMFIDNNGISLAKDLNGKYDSESFNEKFLVNFKKPKIALAFAIHNIMNSRLLVQYFDVLKCQLLEHFGLTLRQLPTIDGRIEQALSRFNRGCSKAF